MKSAIWAGAALALCVAPASAQTAPAYDPAKPYPAYTAPRLAIGQPDLQGFWSNATLTATSRPVSLGDRLAFTEEEAAKIEAARMAEVAGSAKRVDVTAVERALGPGESYNDY